MSKSVIVYHTDIDGHLSGAILQESLIVRNPIMVRLNYDDKFPWHLIDKETDVWMADFSLQPWSEMEKLYDQCRRLIWIDHHKTAIDNYNESGMTIRGIREDGTAACRLCWRYFHPGEKEPLAVYYAGVYDVWEWQDVENAIEFQYGTKFYNTDPATNEGLIFWGNLLDYQKESCSKIVEQGKLLMKYKGRSNAEYIKDHAFETTLDDLNVIAVNRKGNSQQFDAIWDPTKYHAMLTFSWAKSMWTVGLYSDRDDVNLGAVAKKYGGGGHKGAAGFQTQELPFELR